MLGQFYLMVLIGNKSEIWLYEFIVYNAVN